MSRYIRIGFFLSFVLSLCAFQLDMDSPSSEIYENNAKQDEVRKEYLLNVETMVLCIALFSILMVMYMQKRKKVNRYEQELERLRNKLSLQDHKISVFEKLIESQKLEREGISKKLHDDIGGLVASIKLHINDLLDGSSEYSTKQGALNEIIENTSSQIRKTAYSIMPQSLTHFGLREAIDDLAAELSTKTLVIQTHFDGMDQLNLKSHHAWLLYKMLRELVQFKSNNKEVNQILIQLSCGKYHK